MRDADVARVLCRKAGIRRRRAAKPSLTREEMLQVIAAMEQAEHEICRLREVLRAEGVARGGED